MKNFLFGAVVITAGLVLGNLVACVATPEPDESGDPAAVASPEVSTAAVESDAHPDFTTVYECTIDSQWWATRAICQSHCAGGTCFACGVDCQN